MKRRKLSKVERLILSTLPVIVGLSILSWNYFVTKKQKVYDEMSLLLYQEQHKNDPLEPDVEKTPDIENLGESEAPNEEPGLVIPYVATLEIPKIKLKKGLVEITSTYNNVNQNIMTLPSSAYPDVSAGNLILVAHSGDAYISYFRYLYKLKVGDKAYVTYQNQKYQYEIKNIYEQDKTGNVAIYRDYSKKTLTLITCTYQSDTKQTVYIAEMIE